MDKECYCQDCDCEECDECEDDMCLCCDNGMECQD